MSKRSKRVKRDDFQAELVVLHQGGKVVRLHGVDKLFNPANKIFVLISGFPLPRGRKKRYKRVIADPLDQNVCFKLTPRKRTPHEKETRWVRSAWPTQKKPKPVGCKGKKMKLSSDTYAKAMKKVEQQLEALINE